MEEYIIESNYRLKINIIKKSNQKEYINIYLENSSTNEKYNSNFDFDFLKNKSFFSCLDLQTIYSTLKIQLKNQKVKIDSGTSGANKIKLNIILNKENEPLILFIPKYIENEQIDMDEILKLKTLCANSEKTNNDNNQDLRGFTSEIIKNKEEADMLMNWINEQGGNLKIEKRLYKPKKETNSWSDFHEACDSKGPTLILCEELFGKRFGGFASVPWDLRGTEYYDGNAFVFSLDKKKKYSNKNNRIYCGKNHGPHFHGPSLGLIWDNPNGEFINGEHFSKHHDTYYNIPNNELTGGDKFILKNMEVYLLK
jgi:hypothetical protein